MSDALAVVHPHPEPRIVGDTSKHFRISVRSTRTGLPFDLGGGTYTFKLVTFDRTTVIVDNLPCNQDGGDLWYEPRPQDVAVDGHFLGCFTVVTSEGVVIKYGHYSYEIAKDL